jgi:bifunctional oligoribonuclease and PAP phosphatase NrnA
MSYQDILKIIKEQNSSFVLLLCHGSADPDAVCSAYAFQGFLKRLIPDVIVEIGAPLGVNKPTKKLLEQMPITVNLKPNIESADVIFLIDTNTIEQLTDVFNRLLNSPAPLIVIDHHTPNFDTAKTCKLCMIDEKAAATCEIIFELFEEANLQLNLNEAKAIFTGMAFDTRHFALGDSRTFRIAGELVKLGVDAREALTLFNFPIDSSERLAKLKAAKRAKISKVGEWIIAVSNVSAYGASAAKSLVDLGAHMAAVAGKKEDKLEISLRCTRDFSEKAGIHLGKDIAQPLGEYTHGVGGGHAMAAGVNGKGEVDLALKKCVKLLKDKIANSE